MYYGIFLWRKSRTVRTFTAQYDILQDVLLKGKSTDRSPFSSQKNLIVHVYIPT